MDDLARLRDAAGIFARVATRVGRLWLVRPRLCALLITSANSSKNAVLLLGTLRSHVLGDQMRITHAVSCRVLRGRLDAPTP